MFELVELKTGRIIERYDYDFDEFIKTKYGGFFSLIIDDVFMPGDVRPEFAWIRARMRKDNAKLLLPSAYRRKSFSV
jgi:hypothetical protein